MSCFTQYKLKDGRRIRGRYDSKSTKVCISRSDLEGLIYEADVAYEQAEQLQTIIENLVEIKRQAITDALDKVKAEIDQDAFKDINGSKYIFVNRINQIIDSHKVES
jgi:hypothetical protein